jgi:hypothetical protein
MKEKLAHGVWIEQTWCLSRSSSSNEVRRIPASAPSEVNPTWSLSNQFTSALKQLDSVPQRQDTARLGEISGRQILTNRVLASGAVYGEESSFQNCYAYVLSAMNLFWFPRAGQLGQVASKNGHPEREGESDATLWRSGMLLPPVPSSTRIGGPRSIGTRWANASR